MLRGLQSIIKVINLQTLVYYYMMHGKYLFAVLIHSLNSNALTRKLMTG